MILMVLSTDEELASATARGAPIVKGENSKCVNQLPVIYLDLFGFLRVITVNHF